MGTAFSYMDSIKLPVITSAVLPPSVLMASHGRAQTKVVATTEEKKSCGASKALTIGASGQQAIVHDLSTTFYMHGILFTHQSPTITSAGITPL
jgi:hypothetical protein